MQRFLEASTAYVCNLHSQQRQGPLSAPPLSVVAFFPSVTFMSPEQRQKWKEGALAAMQDAPEGLRKQYEVQIRRFADPSSPEGEYVHRHPFFLLL